MDLNLFVVCGRLATTPDYRAGDTGTPTLHMLVIVRSDSTPGRHDVLPVVVPDPPDHLVGGDLVAGSRVWAAGELTRPLGDRGAGARGRLALVADHVTESDAVEVGKTTSPG